VPLQSLIQLLGIVMIALEMKYVPCMKHPDGQVFTAESGPPCVAPGDRSVQCVSCSGLGDVTPHMFSDVVDSATALARVLLVPALELHQPEQPVWDLEGTTETGSRGRAEDESEVSQLLQGDS
jgi:hypothetical protein